MKRWPSLPVKVSPRASRLPHVPGAPPRKHLSAMGFAPSGNHGAYYDIRLISRSSLMWGATNEIARSVHASQRSVSHVTDCLVSCSQNPGSVRLTN